MREREREEITQRSGWYRKDIYAEPTPEELEKRYNSIIDDNNNVKFIRNIVCTPNVGFNIPKILYITDFDKSSIENAGLGVFTAEKILSNTHIANLGGAIFPIRVFM